MPLPFVSLVISTSIAFTHATPLIRRDSTGLLETSSPFPIDFVYCWSGEESQHDGYALPKQGSVAGDHNVGQGFGELRWSLKYLEAHAPWFNKAYILVNPGPNG